MPQAAAPVTLGPQGRLVVPAPLRKELGLETGEQLMARVEDGRLILERRDAVLARLQQRFAHIPPGVSLSGEVIADRRADARREAGG
jgi:AbrB family looped-hinge helix DNA binding protein